MPLCVCVRACVCVCARMYMSQRDRERLIICTCGYSWGERLRESVCAGGWDKCQLRLICMYEGVIRLHNVD